MNGTLHIWLTGLAVLFFSVSGALCEDFTDPGFSDINVSDNDFDDSSVHWDDVSFNGSHDAIISSAASIDAGEGKLSQEALTSLLNELEQRLLNGDPLDGEITIDGKVVSLSEEVKRQQKIWDEASRRFLVSPDISEEMSPVTDIQFVDSTSIDSPDFERFFASVIDSDHLAQEEASGKQVVAADYIKVSNLYKSIDDDMFSLRSSRFLAANSTDFEVASKARASADIIESRMKNYITTLKRVLIKG